MFVAINQSETAIFDYKASWFVRLLLAYIRTQILEIALFDHDDKHASIPPTALLRLRSATHRSVESYNVLVGF
jgi:hypothetical protein